MNHILKMPLSFLTIMGAWEDQFSCRYLHGGRLNVGERVKRENSMKTS